jgi:hypothetical protein
MKSDLHILIEELQREHDYLEEELNTCLKEWDFKGAEAFKEPLFYTREKLRILKNLENPDFDSIVSLRGKIERLRDYEGTDEIAKFATQRMKDRIPEYEKELLKLENNEKKIHDDSDELIICLEKVLAKKISQFDIAVEDEGIVFEISKKERILKIEIRRSDNYTLDYTTTKNGLTKLKTMGFQINEMNAIKEIRDFQEKKILSLIELLSRIAFEVFRLYGNKEAKIKMKK